MRIDRRAVLGGLGSSLAAPATMVPSVANAATFTLVRRIKLGATQAGKKTRPEISILGNGTIAAGWINRPDFITSFAYVRFYNANGTPASGIIQMGGLTGPTEGANADTVRPVAVANNKTLVIFSAKRTGATGTDFTDVFAQLIGSNFQKIGTPIRVNQAVAGQQVAVMARRLSNGNVLVLWRVQGTTVDSVNLMGRVLAPDGTPLFPEKRATNVVAGAQVASCLTAIDQGRSIFTYYTIGMPSDPWKVYAQTLDAQADRVGAPVLVKSAATTQRPFGSAGVFFVPGKGPIYTWLQEASSGASAEATDLARLFWRIGSVTRQLPFTKPINPATTMFPLLIGALTGKLVFLQPSENVTTQVGTLFGTALNSQNQVIAGPKSLGTAEKVEQPTGMENLSLVELLMFCFAAGGDPLSNPNAEMAWHRLDL